VSIGGVPVRRLGDNHPSEEIDMRYLALIYGDEQGSSVRTAADVQAVMAGHQAFGAEAGGAGVLGGGEALQDTRTATTIRDVDGKDVITDGPFAETKEQLGGFYILDVADLDEALRWAAKIPHPGSCIELRPVIDFSEHAG
jgi:hypothetical protein